MIDLNNTWCEATQENYDKLVEMGRDGDSLSQRECGMEMRDWIIYLEDDEYINVDIITSSNFNIKNFKQIKLNSSNEFEYIEEEDDNNASTNDSVCTNSDNAMGNTNKKINNFSEFWFEADFEGEILKEVNGRLHGIVKQHNQFECITWNKVGRVLNGSMALNCADNYDLTPIKKAWYEDESNIGKLVYVDNEHWQGLCSFKHLHNNTITVRYFDGGECVYYVDECRPATEEEAMQLVIEE